MKLSEIIDSYLTYLVVEKGDSSQTIETYTDDLNQFIEFCHDKVIKDLSIEDISLFIRHLSSSNKKTSTIIRRTTTIRGLYLFLNRENYIKVPLTGLRLPKAEQHLPNVLSLEEVDALFDVLDMKSAKEIRDRAMLECMYASGLRVSELLTLELGNINFRSGYIRIRGKGNKERIIPIGEYALYYLQFYLDKVRKYSKNKRASMSF